MKHSVTTASPALSHLRDDLQALARDGLRRSRTAPPSPSAVSFCSNDYLGLASRPVPAASPTGAGASRLVDGERDEHRALEREIATWLGEDDCLTFTSGYAANVGALSSLAGPDDVIVSDALNHASLIDGARLSRARIEVVPHCNALAVAHALRAARAKRKWVVTESYFSMDADAPDLSTLRRICDDAGAALIVDEAHALGVLGPRGAGLCQQEGVRADVLIGTFGKAFGAAGAFVAGCAPLTDWLWNRARTFVFSTGLSPAVAAAALANLREHRANDALRQATLANAERLRAGLSDAGIPPIGFGHIVPCIVGNPTRAVAMATALSAAGVLVQAIRPPSVPTGTSRLRFTATARQSPECIEQALATIRRIARSS